MYIPTTATKKIAAMRKRIRAVAGGTSASKTVSIMMILTGMAQSDYECHKCKTKGTCTDIKGHRKDIELLPTLTSVVSESVPHLKRGVMRDFEKFMKVHKYWNDDNWNKTSRTYTFETGSQIEFFSAGDGDELKGGRRDRLFINEANNISLNAYTQLETRTKEFVFIDWNPDKEFWFYTELKDKPNVEFITLTYKDNEALDERIVESIESKQGNARWWRVYGLGLLGEAEGRIYTNWKIIKEIPHEAKLISRGLDFGYTNDPSVCIDIYYYNGGYILDEVFYKRGLKNPEIAEKLREPANYDIDPSDIPTRADSSEPKSIDEIKDEGINILPAEKGKGSINNGISFIQGQKISVTERSVNTIKEYRNFMWKKSKTNDGTFINEPEGGMDHAMDAIRYGLSNEIKKDLLSDTANDIINSVYRNDMYTEEVNNL